MKNPNLTNLLFTLFLIQPAMPAALRETSEDDESRDPPCCQNLIDSMDVSRRRDHSTGLLSLPQHSSAPQLTRMCISVVVVPGLMLASLILYLLGSRYEHLADIAEFMLNATLLMSKMNH